MAHCVPYLRVKEIPETIRWFESIGFQCTATNRIWEPECEINWAEMTWGNASFMLGPDERENIPTIRDTSIWFNVDSVEDLIETLEGKNIEMHIEAETFYGRKVVSFKDINGFEILFSSATSKQKTL